MDQYKKEELRTFLGDYIKEITAKSKGKNQFVCPFCGSGTGSDGTGAFTYYPETNTYNCFKCSENGDIFKLYAYVNHLDIVNDFPRIVDELSQKYNIIANTPNNAKVQTSSREHIYKNADGSIFGKKVINKFSDGSKNAFWTLFDNKTKNFHSIGGLSGQKAPLYNADLLQTRTDNTVYIVEGEKDADTLVKLGLLATTVPNGAGFSKWLDIYNNGLQERDIIILTDNDEAGRQYGETIAKNVIKIAKSVKIIPSTLIWDKCPPKGDISDISQLIGTEKMYSLLISATGQTPFFQSESEFELNLQYINKAQVRIPKIGNTGQNGTLKGLGLSGFVFLKINFIYYYIMAIVYG